MAYGLFISSLVDDEMSAMQFALGSFYPVLLLSGKHSDGLTETYGSQMIAGFTMSQRQTQMKSLVAKCTRSEPHATLCKLIEIGY